jgi:prepilin-type processing-associated H-X9-DG protein
MEAAVIKSCNRNSRPTAFSLVELLIVIGILVIFLSLLLPYLSWAKELGKRNVCASNQRQLTLAWVQYATANSGYIMSALTGTPTQAVANWVDNSLEVNDWNHGIRPAPYADAQTDMANGRMWPYLTSSLQSTTSMKTYVCPSDWRHFNYRSYSFSSFLNGYEGNGFPYVTRLYSVKRPTTTWAIIDEYDDRDYNINGFELTPLTSGSHNTWIDVPGAFHTNGTNLSFVDGHVEYWPWNDPRTLQMVYSVSPTNNMNNTTIPNDADLIRLQMMLGDQQ